MERSEEVYLCQNEDREDMKELTPDRPPLDIRLENVTFRYTGSIGKAALENISFTIPSGKMTAIVGESGSGKTTLMKLLLKFYTPTEGHIRLGTDDLADYRLNLSEGFRHRHAGELHLFRYDTEQYHDGEAFDETDGRGYSYGLLGRIPHIGGLPLGLQTHIGAEGIGVSGGEKQRIMIARAIYKNPLYLMMDEATSSAGCGE